MAMGVIENIQDYFVKNSQEYKAFINEMKKTSPEEFYMDGERKFSKNEQKFLRLFEKDQGKKTVIHSEPADFLINNKQDIIIKEIEKIKVIPATNEQIEESFTDRMASIDVKAYVELFSEKQLNSIPDVIETNILDKGDKIQLLLNNYPDLYENGINFTYVIDENSYLKKHIIKDDYNPEVRNILEFVSKENVFFENKSIQLDESQKVEITPATAEQKLQYSQHMEGIEFTDMPIVDFPKFTEAQLNSVPDIINGIPVTDYEKKMILLDSFEFSASNNWSSTFSIDENNKLIEKYHDVDHNNEVFEIKKHISKEDVMYVHQKEIKIQQETVKPETTKHVQLSNESNLSIDNIYGFSPTVQQKEDLKNGKGITGEIKGKNYFIMLSAQEKNKGSLQILSMEKAKELKLVSEKIHNQKNIKQTGLRV
jgi:hypothetical protein